MPGIRTVCIAHSKVDIIHCPGNGTHHQMKAQFNPRKSLLEPGHPRHHPMRGKGRRYRQGDGFHSTPPVFDFPKRIFDTGKAPCDGIEQDLTCQRQIHTPGAAQEKGAVQMILQPGDHPTDCGRCYIQLLCRF
jgi:hypothetical protein